MKCPFCKHRVNRYDGKHIYRCDRNKHIEDKKEIKYQYLSYNYPFISEKNNLFVEYSVKSKSLPDLKKEFGISYNNTLFLLEYFGLKKRSYSSSAKLISAKKYKKTCLKKYGKDNYSKLNLKKNIKPISFENREYYEIVKDIISNQKHNILKRILDRDNILKKEVKYLYKKYYRYWLDLNDEKKNELVGNNTLIETKVSDCLDKLEISYIRNFYYGKNIFDFKIDNFLLDVNSDFWKANPLIYKENDYLDFPFERIKSRVIWKKDEYKRNLVEKVGYKVIVIWESDIKNIEGNELSKYLIEKLI